MEANLFSLGMWNFLDSLICKLTYVLPSGRTLTQIMEMK